MITQEKLYELFGNIVFYVYDNYGEETNKNTPLYNDPETSLTLLKSNFNLIKENKKNDKIKTHAIEEIEKICYGNILPPELYDKSRLRNNFDWIQNGLEEKIIEAADYFISSENNELMKLNEKYDGKYLYFEGYESGSDLIFIDEILLKDDEPRWTGIHIELTTVNSGGEGIKVEYVKDENFINLRYYDDDIETIEDLDKWLETDNDRKRIMSIEEVKQIILHHIACNFDNESIDLGIDMPNPFKEYIDEYIYKT